MTVLIVRRLEGSFVNETNGLDVGAIMGARMTSPTEGGPMLGQPRTYDRSPETGHGVGKSLVE